MTCTTPPSITRRTARTILVDWANDQGHWVRTLVADVLASRRAQTSERLAEVYTQFLVEKELEAGTVVTVPPLTAAVAAAEAAETLTLLKLDAVENVNALTAGQVIEFNDGLTIVFGKNGTGKSGYVRILKRLARVRESSRSCRMSLCHRARVVHSEPVSRSSLAVRTSRSIGKERKACIR